LTRYERRLEDVRIRLVPAFYLEWLARREAEAAAVNRVEHGSEHTR